MSKKATLFSGAPVAAFTTLDPGNLSSHITLSGGNLIATNNFTTAGYNITRSIAGHSSGKYYVEATLAGISSTYDMGLGIIDSTITSFDNYNLGNDTHAGAQFNGGDNIFYINSAGASSGVTYGSGDVADVAWDIDNQKIWIRNNGGNWNNNVSNDPATNVGGISTSSLTGSTWYLALGFFRLSSSATVNFGATAYGWAAPSGFGNW